MITLYLINCLLKVYNADNFIDCRSSSLWEYESDIALFDIPLKVYFPIVYKTIKHNRMSSIKDDCDMQTLLCGNKVWINVVQLFKYSNSFSDYEVIEKGSHALDTIHIHKSVDLVFLLFNAVLNCAEQFPDDLNMQEKCENIVLRLLANKIIPIKRAIYNLASISVKRRLCVESERVQNNNLCLVLGMPITTEIIVEIICFGLNHSDSSVSNNHYNIMLHSFIDCVF